MIPKLNLKMVLVQLGRLHQWFPRASIWAVWRKPICPAPRKKAAPKKGGKKPGAGLGDTGTTGGVPEGDELMETGGDETSSLELFNEIEARKDTQLRQVIKALDCSPSSVPVCLAGMFPDKVLFEKFKAGHQLKGVPWFVLNLPQ